MSSEDNSISVAPQKLQMNGKHLKTFYLHLLLPIGFLLFSLEIILFEIFFAS